MAIAHDCAWCRIAILATTPAAWFATVTLVERWVKTMCVNPIKRMANLMRGMIDVVGQRLGIRWCCVDAAGKTVAVFLA
jgi:hypothetical protein